MTSQQENKLAMYLALKAVCAAYREAWLALPAFGQDHAELLAAVDRIIGQARKQGSTSSASEIKNRAREELTDAVLETAGAMRAMAHREGNQDLLALTDCNQTSLARMRGHALARYGQDLIDAARPQLSALASYGVTEARVNALQSLVEAYQLAVAKPRQASADAKAATRQLAAEFRTADELLTQRLDRLALQLRSTAPAFYQAYEGARRIGGHARAKEPMAESPVPSAPALLAAA